jgi:cation-transporting ATPase 13A3/4/5
VLSVGPPFREKMGRNRKSPSPDPLRFISEQETNTEQIVPFVITMSTALFLSTYLLLDPAEWLTKLMDLTYMSWDFKLELLGFAVAGFAVMYGCEMYFFPSLARWIGDVNVRLRPKSRKKRKEYKIIIEGMRGI